MIELVIKDILETALDAPVLMELPDFATYRRTRFVFFEKTGSGRTNHINSATVAIQSYGKSLYDAATLNEEVKDAMDAAGLADPRIFSAKLDSDYPFNDESNHRYRYQAVYNITY